MRRRRSAPLDLGPDPGGASAFVNMDDPQADEYLVNDISPERGFRRWAFIHPELRFRVKDVAPPDFHRRVRHPGSHL